ncbi:MAG: hypothetical protein ABEJ02_01060 [Candidatus Paceibacteria bacterium]
MNTTNKLLVVVIVLLLINTGFLSYMVVSETNQKKQKLDFSNILIPENVTTTNNKDANTTTKNIPIITPDKNKQKNNQQNKQQKSATSSNSTTNTKSTSSSQNDIQVTNLGSGELTPKLFAIRGEAPGEWFFEGDFPIEVHNPSMSKTYTTAIAKTDENFMTNDTVDFYAVVDMRKHNVRDIVVEFKKSNPSGKQKLADSETLKLKLEDVQTKNKGKIAEGVAQDGCVISGCSNQFCASKGKVGSGCTAKPEYQCRRSGICSRDKNGNCGWVQDKAMNSCVNKSKKQP